MYSIIGQYPLICWDLPNSITKTDTFTLLFISFLEHSAVSVGLFAHNLFTDIMLFIKYWYDIVLGLLSTPWVFLVIWIRGKDVIVNGLIFRLSALVLELFVFFGDICLDLWLLCVLLLLFVKIGGIVVVIEDRFSAFGTS